MAIVKGKENFIICLIKSKSLVPKDFLAFCVDYMMECKREDIRMIILGLVDTEEERDKFEALFHRYKCMMFCSIDDIINDKHLSEDILQEVFIKIVNNIDKINDDINSNETKSFIMTITKNTALDYYRKNAKNREHECYIADFEEAVFAKIDKSHASKLDDGNKIIYLMKNMKETYRDIFMLKYVNGLDNKDIAALLNISEETVRQRISRGKKMLEEKLEDMEK